MTNRAESARRPYRQVVRAASAAETGERILDATVALFWEGPTAGLSLAAVAGRAGVSVQTVIRRFGGRDGLMQAAIARETAAVRGERDPAGLVSTTEAVHQLVAHYEARGDAVLRLLAEEARDPALRPYTDPGRRAHRAWCETVFVSALTHLEDGDRDRRLAELVAICDVYTWKLLRRDAGLDVKATERALVEMVVALTGDS